MAILLDRLATLWEGVSKSRTVTPALVAIPRERVVEKDKLGPAFAKDKHYFQVRVNEMYLTYSRNWFKTYAPMVFVFSEFIYDKQVEAVPFVVGPKLLEKNGVQTPKGKMIYTDTRVAGLHPYRGGRLALTVILSGVQQDDSAHKLLALVERTAGVVDFATALGVYVKVAEVVVEGVQALLGLDATVPVIGWRREFDQDAGDEFEPGYFALIDLPEDRVPANRLWIQKGRLLEGDSLGEAKPYRAADYVLYSILQTADRGDLRTLPFYPLWEHVLKEAADPRPAAWESAKINMASLYQTLTLSPDLTPGHAEKLDEAYQTEMLQKHQKAVGKGKLSSRRATRFDQIRERSLKILEM